MNIPLWPGSSSFSPGDTPFGFYDNDPQFQVDADKVANFCARRLGYPLNAIELQDINFYTAFEQAVTVYGNEVYAYKARQEFLDVEGNQSTSSLNNSVVIPNTSNIVNLSEQYGVETGAGGNVTWRTGSLELEDGYQNYDMNEWAEENNISASELEIKRIFYQGDPALVRFYDPYVDTGTGMMSLLEGFGFGSDSPAINFLLMPLNYDLQKLQAIELNDQVRRSNYTFELVNNQLRIFPIPDGYPDVLYFEYILKSDRVANSIKTLPTGSTTDISNIPYINPSYALINSIGRSWIFEYALALSKEMLGYVRGKFNSIPIPQDTTQLNAPDLLSSAKNDQDRLLGKLRDYLESTSREKLLERKKLESEHRNDELKNIPFPIYIA